MTQIYKRGFSLIELMIAIAIVSILASIAVPSYRSYVQQSTVQSGVTLLASAKKQVAEYYDTNGHWPTTTGGHIYMNDTSTDALIKQIKWATSVSMLEARFGAGAGSELNNKIIWLEPTLSDYAITWKCVNHSQAGYALPDDALPSECG